MTPAAATSTDWSMETDAAGPDELVVEREEAEAVRAALDRYQPRARGPRRDEVDRACKRRWPMTSAPRLARSRRS